MSASLNFGVALTTVEPSHANILQSDRIKLVLSAEKGSGSIVGKKIATEEVQAVEVDPKVEEEREPPSCLVCKKPMRRAHTSFGFKTYRCDECRISQFFVLG
jgi:tRNA(Ile2) C34 agmatinyltransferase TiaS